MALKRLFWDIETSPNIGTFWKSGYRINIQPENIIREKAIICICYKWEGHKRVFSLTWDKGDDSKMVKDFLAVAEEADELVAHNGDSFDLKWFNSQCLQHGLVMPASIKTIDTLVIARRRFFLNSNRLDYLGKLLLGKGKQHTEYQMWKDILLDNDPAALESMVEYCKEDVRLLEEVYQKLSSFHAPKTHMGVFLGFPKWTCAHCGSDMVRRKKRRVTTKGMTQHSMFCKDCKGHYTINDYQFRLWEEHGA